MYNSHGPWLLVAVGGGRENRLVEGTLPVYSLSISPEISKRDMVNIEANPLQAGRFSV